ncbi:hypothetical protein JW992_04860 [candidate division KSB1 bacterium]|nr:hypothetical protein [candidate division KSB1 bacterium]
MWACIKIRLRCAWNTLSQQKSRLRRITPILALLLPVILLRQNLLLFASWRALPVDVDLLILNFLHLSFLALFIVLFCSSVSVAIHTHFMSKDLPLLMSQPIPPWQIMTVKQLETAFAGALLYLYFGIPLLLAVGIHYQVGIGYYVILLPVSAAFLLLSIQLAILFASLLISLVPQKQARRWSMAIFALVMLVMWGGFYGIQMSRYDPGSASFQLQRVQRLVDFRPPALTVYLPATWVKDVLHLFLPLSGEAKSIWPAFQLAVAVPIVGGAAVAASLLVWRNDRRGLSVQKGATGFYERIHKTSHRQVSITRALFSKDLKMFRRDLRLFMQIVFYPAIVVIYAMMMPPVSSGSGFEMLSPFIVLSFLGGLVALNTGSLLLPLEGISIIYIKSSALSVRRVVWSKLFEASAFAALGLMTALLILVIKERITGAQALFVSFLLLTVVLSASTIGLLIGVFFGEFKWERVNRIVSLSGHFLSLFCYSFYLGLSALIVAGGIYIEMSAAAILFFLALSGLLVFLGTQKVVERLDSIDWKV